MAELRFSLALSAGLSALSFRSLELSCWAVIDIYLAALEPAVILSVREVVVDLEVGVLSARRTCAAGVVPGVTQPFVAGVMRPVTGVTLPLEIVADGVREVVKKDGVIRPELAGVVLPPRFDATDEGRCMAPGPTVGDESFVVAMNTPQLSGHEKYCFL
jgi:hypothetical protein